MPKGQVRNHSNKSLWVIDTDRGRARARRLAPGRESPEDVDADGFRAEDGTPINGHGSWVKIIDLSTADVRDEGGELDRGCYLCKDVEAHEFGRVRYVETPDWGKPI